MKEKVEVLIKKCITAADTVRLFSGKIRLVSHYDADGICSAAIMVKALSREGKDFHLTIVKQLTSDMIENLSKEKNELVIFTDVGSGLLEIIQEKLVSRGTRVIILDHHEKQGEVQEKNSEILYHINPLDFGISENISGSGVTYLFARALNPVNKDLSVLGIIGAIGDSQTGSIGENWGLMGLNKEILKDAEASGRIKVERGLRLWGRKTRPLHKVLEYSIDPYIPGVSGSESRSVQFLQDIGIKLKEGKKWRTLSDLSEEETKKLASAIIAERAMNGEENPEWIFGDVYELPEWNGELSDANEFATVLNACGKTGNAYIGVALCLLDKNYMHEVENILASYRKEIGKALSWIEQHKEAVRETEHAIYVMAGNNISEHIISNVVSILHKSGVFSDKPVFAFAKTEDGKVKISVRISENLVNIGVNAREITVRVAAKASGEGGGHSGAAGATIPEGNEEIFIREVENLLKQNNLNTAPQEKIISSEASDDGVKDGTTKSKGCGQGTEDKGRGRETGNGKKMEGQGLVRYFIS